MSGVATRWTRAGGRRRRSCGLRLVSPGSGVDEYRPTGCLQPGAPTGSQDRGAESLRKVRVYEQERTKKRTKERPLDDLPAQSYPGMNGARKLLFCQH